jgi:hypothetical protein
MATTKVIIKNIDPNNPYKGTYTKIFNLINKDRIFTEAYETDESEGVVGTEYHLEISETLDYDQFEKIENMKNVIYIDSVY